MAARWDTDRWRYVCFLHGRNRRCLSLALGPGVRAKPWRERDSHERSSVNPGDTAAASPGAGCPMPCAAGDWVPLGQGEDSHTPSEVSGRPRASCAFPRAPGTDHHSETSRGEASRERNAGEADHQSRSTLGRPRAARLVVWLTVGRTGDLAPVRLTGARSLRRQSRWRPARPRVPLAKWRIRE